MTEAPKAPASRCVVQLSSPKSKGVSTCCGIRKAEGVQESVTPGPGICIKVSCCTPWGPDSALNVQKSGNEFA